MITLDTAYRGGIAAFRSASAEGSMDQAWHFLERAHILSQPVLRLHLHCHAMMLFHALSVRDWSETRGTVPRPPAWPVMLPRRSSS
ncbi:MAG: DUF3703 domain-containing protein [Novosphingobium sp.]